MSDPHSLAVQVNEILSKYILVHDDIFKFSVRKLIPIPGIFKEIDYLKHYKSLEMLSEELNRIERELANTQENITTNSSSLFIIVLSKYSASLNTTLKKLLSISHFLCKKSEGEEYLAREYQQDMNIYNQNIEEYKGIGLELNSLLGP